jgi:hypothetical protein
VAKTRLAFAVGLLGLVVAGCSDASEAGDVALDRYLCEQSDLEGRFLQLVSGAFSRDDLGGLGLDPEERKREYRAAGMQRGRFVFWKQGLPRPPFDPPMNVVCQVLVFETAAQAAAWVSALAPDASDVAASGIIWLPGREREVTEIEPIAGGRAFRVVAEEGNARVTLIATYEAEGNIVRSVFAGDRDGAVTAEYVAAIRERQERRLAAQ